MATRQANIVINVDDKSLTQLNDEIQALNAEIDQLTIGTEEWIKANKKLGDLKRDFTKVTREAEKLQGQIEKISGPQQLQAFAKLGAGMVGAFAGVSGVSNLLGIQSEKFDELTAKATTLMSIMGGLNAVAETFSAENIKGLKGIVGGFGKMTTAVKGASKAMKTALITTGIGALIIAITLLIANWEKVKDVFSGAARAQRKFYEESNKLNEQTVTGLDRINKAIEERLKLNEQFEEQNAKQHGGHLVIISDMTRTYVMIQAQNDALQTQIEINEQLISYGDKKVENSNAFIEKLKDELVKTELVLKMAKEERGITKKAVERYEQKVYFANEALKVAQRNQQALIFETENLAAQLDLNRKMLGLRTELEQTNKERNENSELFREGLERDIVRLSAFGDKQDQIYDKQEAILTSQIDQLNAFEEQGSKVAKDRVEQTKKDLDLNQERLKNGELTWQVANEINSALVRQLSLDFKLTDEETKRLLTLNAQRDAIRTQASLYDELVAKTARMAEHTLEMLEANEQMSIEISDQDIYYTSIFNTINDINSLSLDNLSNLELELSALQGLEKIDRIRFKYFEDQHVTYAERIAYIELERDYFVEVKELTNEKLQADIKILVVEQQKLQAQRDQLQSKIELAGINRDILDIEIEFYKNELAIAKTEEERAVATQKLAELGQQVRGNEQEVRDLKKEQGSIDDELQANSREIAKITGEIVQNEEEIVAQIDAANEELEKQEKTWKKLQELVGTYGAEIQATIDVLNAGFELIASLADRRAAVAQQNILDLQQELDKLEGDIDDTEQRRLDILAELEDANGEYYNDLLAELQSIEDKEIDSADNVQAKRDEINEQIAIEEKKKAQAEHDAAAWRKAQAIIDGVIQTTLGVIKALPNVFLSVATGVLGAAGVATIATQKLPPNPNKGEGYVDGGFTGIGRDTEAAGIVHKNEYVVPARVAQSPSARTHIAALENKRVKGYAVGGPVTQGTDMSMDYEKFAEVIVKAVAAQPPSQVSLVAVSNGIRDVELTKQRSGLSR